MKAVLFDLDDTLYPEIDFVKSGFDSVARYLARRYHRDRNELIARMFEILESQGRGKVFDALLQELDIYTEERAQLLVHLYRSHIPHITLYADVMPVVDYLKDHGICLGLITDGMASVQRNKIAALNLKSILDPVICTDELGKENWKPSTVSFRIALELLQIPPSEAAYVADNITKDFLAPNSLGMVSVQIKRKGCQTSYSNTLLQQPKIIINDFKDILSIIGEVKNERK